MRCDIRRIPRPMVGPPVPRGRPRFAIAAANTYPFRTKIITRPRLQCYLSDMTLSPDGVLGSSMARRDKTSAWSAIYLL
jgi:hypothetical protein